MSELTQEKKEAMEVMDEYLDKLIPGIETAAQELEYDRKLDTDEFIKKCIDGLNWVIEIYNRISDVINQEEKIHKEEMNPVIEELGNAIQDKEDLRIAGALKEVIPFLKRIQTSIKEVI